MYPRRGKVPRLVARRVRDHLKLDVPLELQDEVGRLLSNPTRCNSPPFEQGFGFDVRTQVAEGDILSSSSSVAQPMKYRQTISLLSGSASGRSKG